MESSSGRFSGFLRAQRIFFLCAFFHAQFSSLTRKMKFKSSRWGKILERKLFGKIEIIPEAVW